MAKSTERPEFDIQRKLAKSYREFLYSQLFVTPVYPTESFRGQTVIVTGANVGLGLEAARHFYRLGCARLILAVRTPEKGEAAKEDIVRSCSRYDPNKFNEGGVTVPAHVGPSAIEVWTLDLGSTASTLAFAERARAELDRVDVLVENAGVHTYRWSVLEGHETTMQVNVLNTLLLALDMLPQMRQTAARDPNAPPPRLVVVSSWTHHWVGFEHINAPNIYDRLNDESAWEEENRYRLSKLLEILFVRELVARLSAKESESGTQQQQPPVVMNLVDPGLCISELTRDAGTGPPGLVKRLLHRFWYRTAEVGGRTLVLAASPSDAAVSSHGQYLSDGRVADVEPWICEDVGRRAQRKVFEQTMAILELRKPGISEAAGL